MLSEINDIRRGRLQLELSRFHHKTCGDVSDEIPKLARLLVTIEEDDTLSEEEKIGKVHALLFPNSAQSRPQPAQV